MRRFCEEYSLHLNQQKAFDKAGYKGYKSGPSGVFAHPSVKAYIKVLLDKKAAETQITAARVLEEIGRIAFANTADYYKFDEKRKKWVIKPLDELTPVQQACIAEYKPGEYIKLYSKDSALDKLGKHFKLYTDLEAGVQNFVIMPTLKRGGKEIIFDVGKPAPEPKLLKLN